MVTLVLLTRTNAALPLVLCLRNWFVGCGPLLAAVACFSWLLFCVSWELVGTAVELDSGVSLKPE